jgi:hypothetical protein
MDFHSRWFTGHLTYDLEPDRRTTLLRQRESLVPRLVLRPLRAVVYRQLAPRLRQRLTDIKLVLEGEREAHQRPASRGRHPRESIVRAPPGEAAPGGARSAHRRG